MTFSVYIQKYSQKWYDFKTIKKLNRKFGYGTERQRNFLNQLRCVEYLLKNGKTLLSHLKIMRSIRIVP